MTLQPFQDPSQDPNQPYDPSQSHSLVDRLSLIQQRHPWADPTVATTLASAPVSNDGLLGIFDGLKQSISDTWDGISHFYSDPVLQKTPTAPLAIHQYLTSTLGASPIEDTDLIHVQKALQAKGFGTDLAADGTWGSSWNSAYQQSANAHAQDQLSGNKPGSQSAGHAAHGFLSGILPVGALSGILGLVKSIPGDLRTLAADTVGLGQLIGTDAAAAVADTLVGGSGYAQDFHDNRQSSRDTARTIENVLGNNISAKQEQKNTTGSAIFAKIINDVGTAFILSPGGAAKASLGRAVGEDLGRDGVRRTVQEAASSGGIVTSSLYRAPIIGPLGQTTRKAFADNAGQMLTRDAGHQAAQRVPRIIGSSVRDGGLGRRAVIGGIVGGTAGGINAGLNGGDIVVGIEQGAAIGALGNATIGKILPTKAFANRPYLGNIGPVVGKLANEEGLYYKTRGLLATPYQYGAVRTAGTIASAGYVAGLKSNLIGGTENALAPDATGTIGANIKDVRGQLDTYNDALKHTLSFNFLGHEFKPGLDDLALLLHADVLDPFKPSTQFGESVTGVVNKANNILGKVGAIGQFETATRISLAQHIKDQGEGGEEVVSHFISAKWNEAAVHYGAEDAAHKTPGYASLNFEAQMALKKSITAEIWHNPDEFAKARLALTAHKTYFTQYIQRQLKNKASDPLSEYTQGMRNYVEAQSIIQKTVVPNSKNLLTPSNLEIYSDELAAAKKNAILHPEGQTVETPVLGTDFLSSRGTSSNLGAIGAARKFFHADGTENIEKSTLHRTQAVTDAAGFEKELAAAEGDIPAIQEIQGRMRLYAFNNHGDNPNSLSAFDDATGERLAKHLKDRAETVAAEIHLPDDASQELKDAFAAVEKRGYRVVAGTDIGHSYRSDLPPVQDLGKALKTSRRIVRTMGLSPENVSSGDVTAKMELEIHRAILAAHNDPKNPFKLQAYDTPASILAQLRSDKLVGNSLGVGEGTMFELGKSKIGRNKQAIRAIADEKKITEGEAEAVLRGHLAQAGGLTGLSRNTVKRVLTRTENLPAVYAHRDAQNFVDGIDNAPMYTEAQADAVYKAVQVGAGRIGTGLLGLGQIEPFMKTLLLHDRLGTNRLPLGIQALPVALVRARNQYRFQLSPFFSYRRITKVSLKMALDNVSPPPGFNPLAAMMKAGTFHSDLAILDRVNAGAESAYHNLDENSLLLHGQDVFGTFNSRHFEAWYAGRKAAQGASDEQIKKGLVRVFKYGSEANGEGRTALERTTNTIFFPFSFEKTVGRNLGGYLLDRPAQAIVISNALDAYRDFNNNHLDGTNPLAASFYQQHLPLLNEVLRLNTFAHGFSAGEFGGINAPLLNLFMPQSWASTDASKKTLERFVPVVADATRILKEGNEQQRITVRSLQAGIALSEGRTSSLLNPIVSTKTDQAQKTSAFDLRAQLVTALQPVLDKNSSVGTPEEKILWPNTEQFQKLKIAGRSVDKTTLGVIVHAQYPAFDPYAGAGIKIERDGKIQDFIASQSDPTLQAAYRDFNDKAHTVAANLQKDDYSGPQTTQILSIFREQAASLAEKDPKWYALYKKSYQNTFGPLEKQ